MTLQKVLSRVRQAVDDYHMIEEGDRIAVGISGGKDSLTLLLALYELSKFYPKHFTLIAVTVDLGFLMCQNAKRCSERCHQSGWM